MTRLFVTLAVTLLFAGVTFALDCPVTVNAGDAVALEVLYAHEAWLSPWVGAGWMRFATATATATQRSTAGVTAQGLPVAAVWTVNGEIVKQCGVKPVQVFADDLELGHLGRWSATIGG